MNIETQEGWLDDIMLDMETLDDTFSKAIARYEYPFADGADLEDMGQKAHTLKIRCYFIDNDTQATYNDHITLIGKLAQKTSFELLHPKYGILTGKVETVTVRHDDRQRTAQVDIDFVEQMRASIEPSQADDVESVVEGAFLDSQDEQESALSAELSDMGFDVEIELDPELTISEQLKDVSQVVRAMAKEIDGYIGEFSALANEIMQPVNSLVATITYATTIPGRIIGTLTRSVERVARLYDATINFPARFLGNLDLSLHQLAEATNKFSSSQTSAGVTARGLMSRQLLITSAQRHSLEAAYCYSGDEQVRQQLRQTEKGVSFDVLGRYIARPPQAEIMTVRDLEATLAAVRNRIQAAVDTDRTMQALKAMALQLLNHISVIKLERERIISVQLDNPMPLHLVCLRYGLPYNYAERIVSINPTMVNPNTVSATLQIYTLPGGAT